MKRRLLVIAVLLALLYFTFWPVPVTPVAWEAPANPGYSGPHAVNTRLASIEQLPLAGRHGPEDLAVDAGGNIYASTHEGDIVRLAPDASGFESWASTGGRPLGIEFGPDGRLYVADAYRGLLAVASDGSVMVLADEADGLPILYADDLDVARDGRVFFSDASTRFGAEAAGGTLEASLLDILEHGGHGRLLIFEPQSRSVRTLIDGLQFANGVALSPDERYLLVVETGSYRVLRYWLEGPKAGEKEVFVDELPGFPDNIAAGRDGRFWLGLVSPRNDLLDALSGRPWLRRVVQRLPAIVRPKAEHYGHVIALDERGRVVEDLQDPEGSYPLATGVLETDRYLYVSSLTAPALGRLARPAGR